MKITPSNNLPHLFAGNSSSHDPGMKHPDSFYREATELMLRHEKNMAAEIVVSNENTNDSDGPEEPGEGIEGIKKKGLASIGFDEDLKMGVLRTSNDISNVDVFERQRPSSKIQKKQTGDDGLNL